MSDDTNRQLHGVVIRADGTVPFDADVPEHHRERTLRWLAEQGHTIKDVPGTRHVQIQNWTAPNHHGNH